MHYKCTCYSRPSFLFSLFSEKDFTAAKDAFLAACKGKKASRLWGAQCAEQLGLILRALGELQGTVAEST